MLTSCTLELLDRATFNHHAMIKIIFLIAVFFFRWVARHFNMLFDAHMIISCCHLTGLTMLFTVFTRHFRSIVGTHLVKLVSCSYIDWAREFFDTMD